MKYKRNKEKTSINQSINQSTTISIGFLDSKEENNLLRRMLITHHYYYVSLILPQVWREQTRWRPNCVHVLIGPLLCWFYNDRLGKDWGANEDDEDARIESVWNGGGVVRRWREEMEDTKVYTMDWWNCCWNGVLGEISVGCLTSTHHRQCPSDFQQKESNNRSVTPSTASSLFQQRDRKISTFGLFPSIISSSQLIIIGFDFFSNSSSFSRPSMK